MRVLLLTDSHGRGMAEGMRAIDSTLEIRSVMCGSQSHVVWDRYQQRLEEVKMFRPEGAIVHLGHNDLTYHPVHNVHPRYSFEVLPEIIGYLSRMERDFPTCKIIYSTVFPRSEGPYLDAETIKSYNIYTVYNYGKMVQDKFSVMGRRYTLNTGLWFSPREGRHHPVFFASGGLHLSLIGRDVVAEGWVKALKK